jgi:NTE family protein
MGVDEKGKLGLALGSGAARGMAHIGVLRALEEEGLKPDIVVGTSIGALVGGMYAAGKLEDFTEIALGLNWKETARYLAEVSFPRSGLLEGSKITELLTEIVGKKKLEDLPILFRSVTTNILSGEEVVIQEGELVKAIRASIAVPGVFTPARYGEAFLVDGGMVNPVPVNICRNLGAQRVIAVDLNHGRMENSFPENSPEDSEEKDLAASTPQARKDAKRVFAWIEENTKQFDVSFLDSLKEWMERKPMPNIFDVLGNSIRIMEEQIASNRLKIDVPDLLIQPEVGSVRFLEFHLTREMIQEGYRATKEALKDAAF